MENAADRLIRHAGTGVRLARLVGVKQGTVSRWTSGRTPTPEYVKVIAELLESIPPKDWPARWKQL